MVARVGGIARVDSVRLRWSGHRLKAVATVAVDAGTRVERLPHLTLEARAAVVRVLPRLGTLTLSPVPD